jgi:hypothetical protein
MGIPAVIAMTVTTLPLEAKPAEAKSGPCTREISKAEVERFLYGKHITACPACGRFRSQCDLGVHAITCQRAPAASMATAAAPVDVLMVVCQNCGAIQFHDRTVIAQWLDCKRNVK